SSGVLVAVDRTDGHELWRYDTGGPNHYFLDAPVPTAGTVLVSDFGTGDLVAVDIRTHTEAWRTFVGGATRVGLQGSTAITAGFDTNVRATDVTTGTVRWTNSSGGSAFGIGVCAGNAYVTAFLVRRFDISTGT